ncbi:hypothetical protein [Actinomadura rupiterrae]|uniref:hypothetical protein n=1 Tax=Actinomadura rupiterrae TaxID=559627 RepID=UPI0020A2F74F|nr:hypothetical protein [Actinomadura rupiterrae]MCP2339176.1 hypothetical protein [Actinomadura rupiterrae]
MARSVVVASGTANVQAVTGPFTLVGVSVRENAGTPAAAALVMRDGTTTGDPARVLVKLAASESKLLGPLSVEFASGIFVHRESGTSELVLYLE